MTSSFQIQDDELAGFGMGGWRQPDGTIQIESSKRIITTWPSEITLLGNTYTLEEVIKGDNNWENAEYV